MKVSSTAVDIPLNEQPEQPAMSVYFLNIKSRSETVVDDVAQRTLNDGR